MSKIGKKNIIIPKESSVKIEGPNLTIKGPKGSKTLSCLLYTSPSPRD